MPTGYTDSIIKGISFKDFTWKCARAFGALVEMKDEPLNAEIPQELPKSDYHIKELDRTAKELERIQNMTLEECNIEAEKEHKTNIAYYKKQIKKSKVLYAKYKEMLEQVKSWEPPSSEHEGLKQFMITQIKQSIDWDCDTKYYTDRLDKRKVESGASWRESNIENLKDDIIYHEKKQKEDDTRHNERTLWIKQLRENLADK